MKREESATSVARSEYIAVLLGVVLQDDFESEHEGVIETAIVKCKCWRLPVQGPKELECDAARNEKISRRLYGL